MRRMLVAMVLMLTFPSFLSSAAAAPPTSVLGFDPAAVVLTPSDLEAEGFEVARLISTLDGRPKLPEEATGTPTVDDLLARIETFDNPPMQHSDDPVEYDQNPPVGGIHNLVWQNCGFYDEPVGNEHAVHSLEHGAVWITYDPDLPASDIAKLEALAEGHEYLLISPYEGLPSPVVASAWDVQLQLDEVDDPYLLAFINYFKQGPQTPEVGASCSGGTSETVG